MYRLPRNYYQIYRVDHKRNREQMVDEVEGLHEAEKLIEKYLRNMTASEVRDEISYYRSTLSSRVPKMFGLSRASYFPSQKCHFLGGPGQVRTRGSRPCSSVPSGSVRLSVTERQAIQVPCSARQRPIWITLSAITLSPTQRCMPWNPRYKQRRIPCLRFRALMRPSHPVRHRCPRRNQRC